MKCLAIVMRRGGKGTGSIGVSVGRSRGSSMAAERIGAAAAEPQTCVGEPWPKMRRSRSVTLRAPAFFKMLAR
ncbi:hypothetical protein ABIA43_001113 [Bradyrhizobium sp. USDA 328]|jgi:hypothetical protein